MRRIQAPLLAAFLLAASGGVAASCGGGASPTTGTTGTESSTSSTGTGGSGGQAASGTTASFDLGADLTSQDHFYDFPYPSDLRLTKNGTPDLTGLPYPSFLTQITTLVQTAMEHPGFPVVPVAYFNFSAPLASLDASQVVAADKTSTILLVDVDPASPDRGALTPVVATTPPMDGWVTGNLLAIAARPGFVLYPDRKYAFVVMKALGDANGQPLVAPAALDDLRAGKAPAGADGQAALALYEPLWDTLGKIGVDATKVAAATVFTTGDVVASNADLASKLAAKYPVTIDGLQPYVDPGATQTRYCALTGTVTYPQFQTGTPPFDSGGLFDLGSDGLPVMQGTQVAPVAITLPVGQMPAAGFPLVTYVHGSGGLSTELIDRGTWVPMTDTSMCAPGTVDTWNGVTGCNQAGEGPAYVLAPFGFAMAGSAMPVNPERLPGASETAYLNLGNLAAMRDTFRQGIIEQHMLLDALTKLAIDPATLGACTGVTLPPGATAFSFDAGHLLEQGQSMGAMYANLVSAAEPRIKATLPTGAGGYWSHFILITPLIPDIAGKVGVALLGTTKPLTFLHPGLMLFETASEAIDPMISMPRLARRPLPGHPVRPVYEPVAQGDSFFPEATYDAMALAYGHKEAGSVVWSTMQDALKLEGEDGIIPYPVKDDVTSDTGASYTGMVVQYVGDGIYDPHSIFTQLDAVKYQYGCFFSTFLANGTAVVPAPAPLGTPCPTQ
jgi:hypothetical protein